MSRSIRLLLVMVLALAGAAIGAPAWATADRCGSAGSHWGSLAKAASDLGPAHLVAARAARHACWDRVVFELDGPAAGYSVEYVNAAVQDGSGAVLPVSGGARLQMTLHHADHDDRGAPTYPFARPTRSVEDVGGFTTLRSVVYGGGFEGYTTFGVGVRARLPFRVFTLDGPGGHGRIILDVAHRW